MHANGAFRHAVPTSAYIPFTTITRSRYVYMTLSFAYLIPLLNEPRTWYTSYIFVHFIMPCYGNKKKQLQHGKCAVHLFLLVHASGKIPLQFLFFFCCCCRKRTLGLSCVCVRALLASLASQRDLLKKQQEHSQDDVGHFQIWLLLNKENEFLLSSFLASSSFSIVAPNAKSIHSDLFSSSSSLSFCFSFSPIASKSKETGNHAAKEAQSKANPFWLAGWLA